MITRRVLAVLAVVAMVPAGCSTSTQPAPVAAPAESPKATLHRTAEEIRKGNYSYDTIWGGYLRQGYLALPDGLSFALHRRGAEKRTEYDYRRIGEQRYVRLGGDVFDAQHWWRLDSKDAAYVRPDIEFAEAAGADLGGVAVVLDQIVDGATRDGNTITGTVDFAGSTARTVPLVLAKPGRPLPFTATVDAKGLLTRIEVQVPAAEGQEADVWRTSVYDFGTTKAPEMPIKQLIIK
ncbi:hypothetical protein [Actinoplanes sp. L3-i22]|uniref:hypothetical protein n=1 Tax=Actinoplanes sp. L3-i22 TaxID=2836373 RepID=UPI001C785F0A|nr:hypothetical protein [Actinoplanes sp. L3-i22]BCY09559.1 hypothetical protein L3i22_046470 [Actinoplanes sp. L3-i22]